MASYTIEQYAQMIKLYYQNECLLVQTLRPFYGRRGGQHSENSKSHKVKTRSFLVIFLNGEESLLNQILKSQLNY